jgi:ABC-type multidrug transport system fused ATPase/permease subunit
MFKLIRVYKNILPYFWNTKRAKIALLLTSIFMALEIVLTTYFPYAWRNIIASANQHQPTTWFISSTLILCLVWFLKHNLVSLKEMVFFHVTNEAIKGIRLKTVLKMHHISLQKLSQYHIQEIISATTRVSYSIHLFMQASFVTIFPNIGKLISLSIALVIAEKFCMGILLAAFLSLVTILVFFKSYMYMKHKAWHITDNVVTVIEQALGHTATIRFHPKASEKQLLDWFTQEAEAWQKYNSLFYAIHLAQDLIFYGITGIFFCFITVAYAKGTIALDKLVLIYGLISSMHKPLLSITNNLRRFVSGLVDLDKTFTILDLPDEPKPRLLPDTQPKPIQLIDVSFAYTEAKPLLKSVNLTIYPGDKIAICGVSGTGKSTLCQLIVGLLKPQRGSIVYADASISDIQPASLGQILTYIPQAYAAKELAVKPHRYGQQLYKKKFSPGEYQRYLLNNLLKEQPQIVVLDEALNALDAAAANQLIQAVTTAIPTVILVSHTKEILDKMDKIYELKNGCLYQLK